MMILKTALLVTSIVSFCGRAADLASESDDVALLQGQIHEKSGKKIADDADVEPASSYNLPADAACENKEAAASLPKNPATASKPAAPTANFVDGLKPVRLTPEAESGDPPGANALRALLEIAIIAIVFDSMRRWHLKKKEAAKEKDDSAKATKSEDAETNWLDMVNAASKGDEAKFAKALQRSRANAVTRTDAWGCTALHFAAAGGSTTIATELLKRGAEVDALDASEETPLHFAARAGHAPVCELLLDAGAKIDPVNVQDFTPFVIAGQSNQESCCRLFADRGAGVAGMSDEQLPSLVVNQLVRKVFAGAQ